jgi:hypothetical protein
MTTLSLAEMIDALYPGAVSSGSCRIYDDGTGPKIVSWNAAKIGHAKPAEADIPAAFNANPQFGFQAQLAALVAARCALVDAAEVAKRAEGVALGAAFGNKIAQIRVPSGDDPTIEDIAIIDGASLKAFIAKTAQAAFSITFTMQDNSDMVLSADQMIALGQLAGARVSAIHDAAKARKDAVRAAGAVTVSDQAGFDAAAAAVAAVSVELAV